MMTSLRSKWTAGKARGGRISESIRNRRATQPPAHFQRNPPGRGRLAVFPRCSLLTFQSRYARRSREVIGRSARQPELCNQRKVVRQLLRAFLPDFVTANLHVGRRKQVIERSHCRPSPPSPL